MNKVRKYGAYFIYGLLAVFAAMIVIALIAPKAHAGELPQLEEHKVGYMPGDVDCIELLPAVRHAYAEQKKEGVLIGVWFEKSKECKVYDLTHFTACKDHKGPRWCTKASPHEALETYLHARRIPYKPIDNGAVFLLSTK